MKYAFEKLEVWQKSRLLVREVYLVTKAFPAEEKFGLTSQIRRASVSICSMIAEGSYRWNKKDKALFYEIAFGSLIEVLNQLILAHDLGFISKEELDELRQKVDEVSRMLDALYKSVNVKS